MNNWILPHIKEDIDEIHRRELVQVEMVSDLFCIEEANYIIIDAAIWDFYMDDILYELDVECHSLFATRGADLELDTVAPYIIKINDVIIEWLRKGAKKELRLLYLQTDETIEGIRKHLRRFLRVKTEDGRWLFFRFYDPYVINAVIPVLKKEQLEDFFSKISFLLTEDIRINERRIFYLNREKQLAIKVENICG